jgi:hypothetical protein
MECSCGNSTRWWRGKRDYLVCYQCYPCPLDALAVLARRRGAWAVQQVQAWQQAGEAS